MAERTHLDLSKILELKRNTCRLPAPRFGNQPATTLLATDHARHQKEAVKTIGQEQSSGDQHNLTVQNLPILVDKERPSHYVKEGGDLLQPNQPNSGGLASFRRILFSKANAPYACSKARNSRQLSTAPADPGFFVDECRLTAPNGKL